MQMKQLLQLIDLYVELTTARETRARIINEKEAEDFYRKSENQKKAEVVAYLKDCEIRIDELVEGIGSDLYLISSALDQVKQCVDNDNLLYEQPYKDVILTRERCLAEKEALLEGKATITRLKNEISSSLSAAPLGYVCKQLDIRDFFRLSIPAAGHVVEGVLVNCSPPQIRFDCGYLGTCEDKNIFINLNVFCRYKVFVASVNRTLRKCTFSFNKAHLISLLSRDPGHRFKGRKFFLKNICLVDIGLLVGRLRTKDQCKSVSHFYLQRSSVDYSRTVFCAAR